MADGAGRIVPEERLTGVLIWLLVIAGAAYALDLLGLLTVPVATAVPLLALGGALTVLVETFLRYFAVGRLF